jgi:hypothetical protein
MSAAVKRSERLKKILAKDPAFTNVLVGILMLFYESLWIVILYDTGRMRMGVDFWWDLQLISAGVMVLLTAPFLLSSLFLASSMTDTARRIVGMCSGLIGLTAAVFTVSVFLETGGQLKPTFLLSRLPWSLFGLFVLLRLPMLKTQTVRE